MVALAREKDYPFQEIIKKPEAARKLSSFAWKMV
jgi:hypothetical protein